MRAPVSFAILLLAGLLAGCKPELPTVAKPDLPDLSGEWAYSASEMRLAGSDSGAECRIEGLTLRLGPWANEGLSGRSTGGELRCTEDLAPFSRALLSYPVREGGFVALPSGMYFSFSLGSADWRHEGSLSHDTVKTVVLGDTVRKVVFTDTIFGSFRLRTGGVEFQGRYLAVRRPGSR